MFVVSETEAAAIRAAFEQSGELSAGVELRRLFPGVTDNRQARECMRTIASWRPLRPVKPSCFGGLSGAAGGPHSGYRLPRRTPRGLRHVAARVSG